MRAGEAARRAAGWLLLAVPFIPLRALFDDPPGTTWLLSPGVWALGLFIFAAAAWLAAILVPGVVERAAAGVGRALAAPGDRAFRLGALAVLAALLLAASVVAFSRRPLLIDSIIQLFQAKIFASGHVWVPAPELEGFFTTQHMVSDAGRWYSQYPPGHPAALTPGVWLGAPWLVPILFSLVSAWLIADTTRRLFGEGVARVALVLLLLAPFFWFMGASHMNHVSSLLFVALFFWCFVRWAHPVPGFGGDGDGGNAATGDAGARATGVGATAGVDGDSRRDDPAPAGGLWIFVAGLALGAAFLSRPLTAVAIGAACAIPALRIARRKVRTALTGAAGFLALASLYFAFNALTTGEPLTAGYMRLWGDAHGLGFHASPWGDVHTPLTGLRNELVDLGLLHSFLFEWPVPALLPLGAFLAAGGSGHRWEGRLLAGFFAIPAAYFFYWHRDAFLGPRYLYEGLPFLIPLLALSFVLLRRRLRRIELRALGGLDAGTFFAAFVGLAFAWALAFELPQRYRVYATGLESVKRDLAAEARDAGIEEGLIFVKVSWGNRLIARARGAGASAWVVESVYRRSDHCELELVVGRAEAEGWEPERLDREFAALVRPEDEIEVVRLNDDPTLRLVPGRPLAPACAEEIIYDRDGRETMPDPPSYTNYSPHLAANSPDLRPPLVFARDLRSRNAGLRALYPGLPAYLYRGREFVPLP